MEALTQEEIEILKKAVKDGKYQVNRYSPKARIVSSLTGRGFFNFDVSSGLGGGLFETFYPTRQADFVVELHTANEALQARVKELEAALGRIGALALAGVSIGSMVDDSPIGQVSVMTGYLKSITNTIDIAIHPKQENAS